jgi:methionyl-tRNA formyltransferase
VKIIFAGTPEFARSALLALIQTKHEVVCVYTQPDRPAGRGMQLKPSPVKALALAHGLPVEQPLSLRKNEAFDQLQNYPCDLMVVAAYGLILPQAVLDFPRLGCINIHASLLPRWRGAAPIVRAIQAGDEKTGISIMQMEAGLDTGPYYLRYEHAIGVADNAQVLHDQLAALGAKALIDSLPIVFDAQTVPTVQPEIGVTYAQKILKAEAPIDWDQVAVTIVNKVRAFDPFPGATTVLNQTTLKIWSAHIGSTLHENNVKEPGKVIALNAEHFVVACKDGSVHVTEAQLPGGKRLAGRAMMQALTATPESLHMQAQLQ